MTRFVKSVLLVIGALVGVLALLLLALCVWGWFPNPVVAPQVTAAGIRQVQLGMSPAQVVALLGRPLVMASYKGSNTHSMANCANFGATQVNVDVTYTTNIAAFFSRVAADTTVHICDIDDERKHDRRSTLTYTRHGGFMRNYPMLWVHFDRQARVDNVFAKEYAADDYCIYSLETDVSQNIVKAEELHRLFDVAL